MYIQGSLGSNPRQDSGGVIGGQGETTKELYSLLVVLAMDRPWFSSKALWYFSTYNMNCAFHCSRGNQKMAKMLVYAAYHVCFFS